MRYVVIFLAMAFIIAETIYFGNHLRPSCPDELICDGIGLTMLCIGLRK